MNKSKVLGVVLAVGLVLVTVVLAFSVMSRSDQNEPFDYSRADLYPSDAWYVTDAAGVLSADTEAWLAALGNDLYHNVDECDLVVVTVDFTGNKSTEDYAYDLFNDWQIGNAGTNRGVLLLLVTGAEDYWCVQGAGLETRLPTSSISRILNTYLEPDFAVGDYDAGVRATAAALYDELAASFGVNRSASQVQATSGSVAAQPTTGGTAPVGRVSSPALTILGFAANTVLVLIVVGLILVLAVVSAFLPRRRYYHHHYWGGPRPPRPPRPPYGGWGGPRPPRGPRPPMGGGFGGGFGGRPSGGGFTRGGGAGRSSFGGGRSFCGGRSSGGGGCTRGGGAGRGR